MENANPYPATLTIDYPDRPLNRITTFFRVFTVIPIGVILALLLANSDTKAAAGGLIAIPTLLMLLFRLKYPKWWFDWNLNMARFVARVASYAALLTDEYPSTDSEQTVHLQLVYPDAPKTLNRWLPLVKWLLAVPHYIVLAILSAAAAVLVAAAWFVILFTGRLPRGIFDFVAGVFRWYLRVAAYAVLLTTDRYPPFSLE